MTTPADLRAAAAYLTEFDSAGPHGERHAALLEWAAGEIDHLRSLNKDAHAIIDRIWAIFGQPTYEELAGRSIYDLIRELKERDEAAPAALDAAYQAGAEAMQRLTVYAIGKAVDAVPEQMAENGLPASTCFDARLVIESCKTLVSALPAPKREG